MPCKHLGSIVVTLDRFVILNNVMQYLLGNALTLAQEKKRGKMIVHQPLTLSGKRIHGVLQIQFFSEKLLIFVLHLILIQTKISDSTLTIF